MCGIIGEISRDPEHQTGAINELIGLAHRRGPDDGGVWTDNRRCTLGFRRLSILDLSPAGHQPMVTLDDRFALVYNGEVYNFQELRSELEQTGVRLRSSGDAEVVLHTLAAWGARALSRFNGMFALGFYDRQEQRLLLARDHAGIKPLYYLLTSEGLAFASQYDQIMAHPWSNGLPVSREALALYMRLGFIPEPYALLSNTYMLEPGTWLEITSGGALRRGRFFEFPQYSEPLLRGQEAWEAVDAAVSEAVRRHLISDVPVGTFLSGGIDSPLVAAKAAEATNRSIKAYTLGTPDRQLDETEDAMRYAQAFDIQQAVRVATSEDALQVLTDVIQACGEPFADYSIIPTMLISQRAREDVTVMLSGDGGDELFWGYAGRFGSVLQVAENFRQPHWWRSVRWGAKKSFNLGTGFHNLRWPTIGDWYRAKHSHNSEYWLRRIVPGLPYWAEEYSVFEYDGWELDKTAQWVRWNEFTNHLPRVLLKVDRASMYHSLEVRVPLLDMQVVNVAAQIDWQSCLDLSSMRGKLPLRYSLAQHTPHQTTQKRGFLVPMQEWLRTSLRQEYEERVLTRNELLGVELNRTALYEMFDAHLNQHADYSWGLWIFLSLAMWADHHWEHRSSVRQPAPIRPNIQVAGSQPS